MPDARRVRVLVRADNFYPCPCPRLHAMEKGVEQQRDGLHTRTKQACWHGTKGIKTTTGPPANKTDKAGRRTRKSVGEPKSETQRPRRACDSHGVHPIYSPHVARSILTRHPYHRPLTLTGPGGRPKSSHTDAVTDAVPLTLTGVTSMWSS